MRRRFFTFASVVSLLLCLTTAVLWVRSYAVGDSYYFATGPFNCPVPVGGFNDHNVSVFRHQQQVSSASGRFQWTWRGGPVLRAFPPITGYRRGARVVTI